MTNTFRLAAAGLLISFLAGCVDETVAVATTPNAAEQACLAAVSRETNNGEVILLGSEFSEAGTLVRVGVGADAAPWKCIAYSDGSTAGVEYMGMNG